MKGPTDGREFSYSKYAKMDQLMELSKLAAELS